tara:strand:- start:329 stop:955 length:627 start_codon:yes stop_codon:yes gene_type:complete
VEKKFNKIYESYVSRYTRGGFLTGDLVKVRDNYKSTEGYKKMTPEYQAKLDDLISSDLNLRVSGIENKYPSDQPGNTDNSSGEFSITVSQETAPGRYDGFYQFPDDIFQPVDVYPNRMPVPNSMVRPNGTQIDPDTLEYEDEDSYIGSNPLKSQVEPGYLPDAEKQPTMGDDRELHNVNTEIDQFGAPELDATAVGGGNMPDTSIYLK